VPQATSFSKVLGIARSGSLPVPDLSDFQAMPRPHPFPLPSPSCGQPVAGRTAH
jgi:hypothetical protein